METPTLTEMGITSVGEIIDFSVRNKSARTDVLTVYYKRDSLSFLPVRRTYEFGRAIKTIVADGGSSRMEETYELSPILQSATKELLELLQKDAPSKDPKAAILEQFEALKSEIDTSKPSTELAARLSELDKLIRNL